MAMKTVFYFSVDYLLSEVTKQKCLDSFSKMPSFRFSTRKVESKKIAAVLVPLCEVDSKMSLMYTLRSEDLKRHSGLVSFPGGMADIEDKNLVDTALRETEEETGVLRSYVDVWGISERFTGTLDKGLAVYPVFGFIKNYDKLTLNPNPGEVDEIFTMPLEDLCNLNNVKLQTVEVKGVGSYTMPQYLGGPKEIWGMTAVITDAYLRSIFPYEVYSVEPPCLVKNN